MIPLSWDFSFFLFLTLFFIPCSMSSPWLILEAAIFPLLPFTLYPASTHIFWKWWPYIRPPPALLKVTLSQPFFPGSSLSSSPPDQRENPWERVGGWTLSLLACSFGILTEHTSHPLFCKNLSRFSWSLPKKESSFFCSRAWDESSGGKCLLLFWSLLHFNFFMFSDLC